MEIADNQRPIDLSRKCRYYDNSSLTRGGAFTKSLASPSVTSSRLLPDLIPISLFRNEPATTTTTTTTTTMKVTTVAATVSARCFSPATQQALNGKRSSIDFSSDQRSLRERKEMSQFRGTRSGYSALSASSALSTSSKMRKSKSDTRMASPFATNFRGVESKPTSSSLFNGNIRSAVPKNNDSASCGDDVFRKYADKHSTFDSSFKSSSASLSSMYKRSDKNEITSSMMSSHSDKYVRQGPGVSLNTIQSLRKLLDKRKSMRNDN